MTRIDLFNCDIVISLCKQFKLAKSLSRLTASAELHRASLLCRIFASSARAQKLMHIQNVYKMVAFSKGLTCERQIIVISSETIPGT